jgi:hypothetical protein
MVRSSSLLPPIALLLSILSMPCVGSLLLPDLLPVSIDYDVRRVVRVFLPPVFSLLFSLLVWTILPESDEVRGEVMTLGAMLLSFIWIVVSGLLWWLFGTMRFAPAG